MQNTAIKEPDNRSIINIRQINFDWNDNPGIQRLLDVISSIIADEYIQIAKENREVFLENEP